MQLSVCRAMQAWLPKGVCRRLLEKIPDTVARAGKNIEGMHKVMRVGEGEG